MWECFSEKRRNHSIKREQSISKLKLKFNWPGLSNLETLFCETLWWICCHKTGAEASVETCTRLRSSSGTIICRRWQECDLSTSVGKPNWFAQTEPKQFLDSLRDLTLLKAVFLTPRIRLFVYQSKLNPHDHLEKTRKADPLRSSHFLWDRGQHGAWFHQNALIHPRLPWMVLCCNQCVL